MKTVKIKRMLSMLLALIMALSAMPLLTLADDYSRKIDNNFQDELTREDIKNLITESEVISELELMAAEYEQTIAAAEAGALYGSNGKFLAPIEPIPSDVLPENIVYISTAAELAATGGPKSGGTYYVLTNDIHLTAEWIPINDSADGYYGVGITLDGRGYTINNLYVLESSSRASVGLFGSVHGATIKNLGVHIGEIGINASEGSTSTRAGGLIGDQPNSLFGITIVNSYSTGSVIASGSTNSSAGGLIGYSGRGIAISNSYSTCNVFASGENGATAGGLAGNIGSASIDITIANSYSTGNISASGDSGIMAGGLAGNTGLGPNITITNSYSTGDVSASGINNITAGGLAGSSTNYENSIITSSYSSGDVLSSGIGNVIAGGLTGDNSRVNNLTITSSYSSGDVSDLCDTYGCAGGLVGRPSFDNTTITNSYSTGDVYGTYFAGGLVGDDLAGGMTILITNSYSTGTISARSDSYGRAGGLLGRCRARRTTITNSYSTGNVCGTEVVGGLIGIADGDTTITNSYSVGDVFGTFEAGGLIGGVAFSREVNITYSYRLSTQTITGEEINQLGTPLTPEQMRNLASFEGWDPTIWTTNLNINDGFPYLIDNPPVDAPPQAESFIRNVTLFKDDTATTSIASGDTVTLSVDIAPSTTTVTANVYVGSAVNNKAWHVGWLTFQPGTTVRTASPFTITNDESVTYDRIYIEATSTDGAGSFTLPISVGGSGTNSNIVVSPQIGIVNTEFTFIVRTPMSATALYMYSEAGDLADTWSGSQHYTDDTVANERVWTVSRIIHMAGNRTLTFFSGNTGERDISTAQSVSFSVLPGEHIVQVIITNPNLQTVNLGSPYPVSWTYGEITPDYVTVMIFHMGNRIAEFTTTAQNYTIPAHLISQVGEHSIEVHPFRAAATAEAGSVRFIVSDGSSDMVTRATVLTPNVIMDIDDFICEIITVPAAERVVLRYENGGTLEARFVENVPEGKRWIYSNTLSSVGKRIMAVIAFDSDGNASIPRGIEVNVRPQDVTWNMTFDSNTGNLNIRTNDNTAMQKLTGVDTKIVIRQKGFRQDLFPFYSPVTIIIPPYNKTWNVFSDFNLAAGQTYEVAIAYLAPFVNSNGGANRVVYWEFSGGNEFTVPSGLELPRIYSATANRSMQTFGVSPFSTDINMDISGPAGEYIDFEVVTNNYAEKIFIIIGANDEWPLCDWETGTRPDQDDPSKTIWSFSRPFYRLFNKAPISFRATSGTDKSGEFVSGYTLTIDRADNWNVTFNSETNMLDVRQIDPVVNDPDTYWLYIEDENGEPMYGQNADRFSRINAVNETRHRLRVWDVGVELWLGVGTYRYEVRGGSVHPDNLPVALSRGSFTVVHEAPVAGGEVAMRITEDNPRIYINPEGSALPLEKNSFKQGDIITVNTRVRIYDAANFYIFRVSPEEFPDLAAEYPFLYIPKNAVAPLRLLWPVIGVYSTSSHYGMRTITVNGKTTTAHHTGVDIPGSSGGQQVIAVANGIVSIPVTTDRNEFTARYTCCNNANGTHKDTCNFVYGNFLVINHTDGSRSLYAHLSSFSVSNGEEVRRGQQIGTVGTTGNSTGAHLHFEFFTGSKTTDRINPLDRVYESTDGRIVQSLSHQADMHSVYINSYNNMGNIIDSKVFEISDINFINELQIPNSTAWVTVESFSNNGQTTLNVTANGNQIEMNNTVVISGDSTTVSIETNPADQNHNFYSFVLNKNVPDTSTTIDYIYITDADDFDMDIPAYLAEGDEFLTISIPKSIETVSINIATENPYAQVSLIENGFLIPYVNVIPLGSDNSTFTINVTAEDGTEQYYTLNVIRSETYSDNTDISEAFIVAYDADDEWIETVAVVPDVVDDIDALIPANTAYYTVYAVTADHYASFSVFADDAEVDFSDGGILPGQNAVIRVTAEDGVTTSDYAINIEFALPFILGNVTGSGEVGPADLVRLARWIAGHPDIVIDERAARVTGNNDIGPADLVRLARFIAGHGVTLGR